MDRRLAPLLLLAVAACGSGSSPSIPPPVVYEEPRATPITCPAPAVVSGGTNAAPDPGATCLKTVRDSALGAVSPTLAHGWVDLGERTVGEVVSFTVPPGTASITLVEQVVAAATSITPIFDGVRSAPQENAAVLAELRDPARALVFTDITTSLPDDGSSTPLFFASASPVTSTLTYPNTTAGLAAAGGGVAAGTWTAQVGDFAYECSLANGPNPPAAFAGLRCDPDPAPGTATAFDRGRYRLFLLTRPAAAGAAAIPASGTLDVTFHLVDAPAPGQILQIDAAAAPTHPAARRLVESYGKLLANAGLCLGTVTFLDAPGWARTRFGAGVTDADPSVCGDFSQLLTLSVPVQRTLDLFLVTRITFDSGSGAFAVVGLDGTIPGPATVNGTVASGAMIAAEDLRAGTCPAPGGALDLVRCGADLVAYVAAHEAGHFLGLYHVTESAGDRWDPLGSTPRCSCACQTGPCNDLVASSCRRSTTCGGGQNLMFWLLETSSRGYLTGEQGQVVRASPLVR